MGDDITIGVTEIVNNIEVTAQPNDQIVDISVIDNADDVTLNITPTVIEINVNKGSSFASWGNISGTLSDQTDLQNSLNLKANLVGGKVPASELPSYVDDVVEVANYAALPTTGETGKIYVTLDNNKMYRWSGSVYIEIASNNAIWGAITGTLSSQTDLQNALNAKQNALNGNGFVKISGTTISYDNNSYYLSSNPNGYITSSGSISGNAGSVNTVFNTTNADFYLTFADSNNGSPTAEFLYTIASIKVNPNSGALTASSFIKSGGTSSQYLKADGSVSTLTNPITGTGTTNYLPKFTGSTALGNSLIYDDGTNIGIGYTSTTAKLNVAGNIHIGDYGTSATRVFETRTSTNLFSITTYPTNADGTLITYSWANGGQGPLRFGNASSVVLALTASGNVLVPTLGTGLVYSNNGTLTSTNPSDSRLKDNIVSLNYGLNEILKLRPVSYNWKNDEINQGKQFGFIAQEVQEVMPELVKEFETEDGERLGLDKEGIYAALVNAIQELKAEIELLKAK